MALKCGIVGLPNVGKSTLFNCLSNAKAQSANFPFCTIEPNVGTITVPDNRLNNLEQLVNPEKVIPTTIESACGSPGREGGREGGGKELKMCNKCMQVQLDYHDEFRCMSCVPHTL